MSGPRAKGCARCLLRPLSPTNHFQKGNIMFTSPTRFLALAAMAVACASVGGYALADTPSPAGPVLTPETKWQAQHPRRTQVNSRLNNQNKRIHAEVKDGQINKKQAAALHTEDHQIRTEERDMASQNNTHITTQEQKTLNQQENAVSGQIGK
jgi:hypothetical protein